MRPGATRSESNPPADSLPPRRRRKDARPSELTAAALALFVDKGFAATRLDDVAARAGVSKGTLYLYFDSKEALFKAVIEEGMVAALTAAEQRSSDFQGSAADLLQQLLFGWWEQIGKTPMAGVSKLIACESKNFPEVAQYYHERVINRGRALLRAALQRGVARGEFRALDLDSAGQGVMGPLVVLASSCTSRCSAEQQPPPEASLQTLFELLLRGLCGTECVPAAPRGAVTGSGA